MLANAVCSLIEHGRIITTLTKAKRLRMVTDKMITLGKAGTLHTRRQAIAFMRQVDVVGKLFEEVAPGYKERAGGYTRIIKMGPRIGDAAEMAIIELVEDDATVAARNKPAEKAPEADAPEADAPKADAPKADAPKADAPKADAPKADAPVVEEKAEEKPEEKKEEAPEVAQ